MNLKDLLEALGSKYDEEYVAFSFSMRDEESLNFYLGCNCFGSNPLLGNISYNDGLFRIAIAIIGKIEDSIDTYKKINQFNINFAEYKLTVSLVIDANTLYFIYASSDIEEVDKAVEKFDIVLNDFLDEDIISSIKSILKNY